MSKMKLRKGDMVIVNSGTEKGKKGEIIKKVKETEIVSELLKMLEE